MISRRKAVMSAEIFVTGSEEAAGDHRRDASVRAPLSARRATGHIQLCRHHVSGPGIFISRTMVKAGALTSIMQRSACGRRSRRNMKVTISPERNPLIGWDITVSVDAGEGGKIAAVEVRVNDFREVNDSFDPPLDSWEKLLSQKGVFPGDNRVDVLVTDDKGKETRTRKEW